MAAARGLAKVVDALASKTVHVKIYPTTRTFAERREVLRVLEGFGEVTMFRSLKVCLLPSRRRVTQHWKKGWNKCWKGETIQSTC